jgi:N-acyl-D-aspartate/D-glutamate deacylase
MSSSLFLSLTLLFPSADPLPAFDFVLKKATIYDGSGNKPVVGDLAISGEKIVAIGKFDIVGKPTEIDCAGLVIAPGFIDLHTHCDTALEGKSGRVNLNYLRQGVTLVVNGNCGSGPIDIPAFFGNLEKNGVSMNVIHQVPHNSVRREVMGNVNRAPTPDELKKMEEIVEKMMKDGAWGLSTGLIYNPGTYSKTDEIIALAKVASKYEGFYASHIRDESSGLLDAISEAIRIGKEAKIPVHISHIKCSGKRTWGKASDAISLILQARKDGQVVTADQYPYVASSTSLAATVIPSRFREGSSKEYLARFTDPKKSKELREAIVNSLGGKEGGKAVMIARFSKQPKWQGKSLAQIAEDEKRDVIDIVFEIEQAGGAQIVNFSMNEEDVRLYMKQEFVATASDGGFQTPGDTVPHPRSYGTYPRKIGRYAIDDGIITLEQAIRSSSGLPADILRLKDRGYLKVGYFADVVVFDPKTFRDTATFDKPHQYATGLKFVFVNGKKTLEDGKFLDVLAGKGLRRK